MRAVEAELEQAEAEAALHRSAAEHAAAIAEKYAEERDSSRAELERCGRKADLLCFNIQRNRLPVVLTVVM